MEFTWHDDLWTLDLSSFGRTLLTGDGNTGLGFGKKIVCRHANHVSHPQ